MNNSDNTAIFTELKADAGSRARTGILRLPHGNVRTPVFMPVGTNATVKALTRENLEAMDFEIILSNTYHLYLRPGTEVIGGAGGLHRFMNWDRNILTDSGGFQVFSLAPFRKIKDGGVRFRSHIDGSYHFLTPEDVVDIQSILGSDIQMQLDVCTGWGVSRKEAEEALRVTTAWMGRAKKRWVTKADTGYEGKFFAIVQGNFFEDLRRISAEEVIACDSPGIAIGGLSVGEEKNVFSHFLAYTASLLPREKPRYVMGIGTPRYILEAIEQGIDMFDCVLPTRTARTGHAFTQKGLISLKKTEYREDYEPIDRSCSCPVCASYSRSYLRHLYKSEEILSAMLISYHNLYFLKSLTLKAAEAIEEGRFRDFKRQFLSDFEGGETA